MVTPVSTGRTWPRLRSMIGWLGRTILVLLLAAGGPGSQAQAANATWNGTTDALWATDANWSAAPAPGTGNTATFNNAGGTVDTLDLGAGVTVSTILFDTANAAAYTIGSGAVGSQTLTLNDSGAVTMNAAVANNQLFNANVALGTATAGTYTFTNNSATRTLTFAGGIQGGAGGTAAAKTLTVTGSGSTVIGGAVANGGASSLALTKAGAGTLTLSGLSATAASNYGGLTTLSGGTLAVTGAASLTGGLSVTAPGTLDLTNGSAAFAGAFADSVNSAAAHTITIGSGQTLTHNGSVSIGSATTNLTVTGPGAWNVNAPGTIFLINSGATTVNMSGLATFTAELGTAGKFRWARGAGDGVAGDAVVLAANSTITAGRVDVGDNANRTAGNLVHTLKLGTGTNTINADMINVGAYSSDGVQDNRDSGEIIFYGPSGSLKIRAANKTGRAAMNVANTTSTYSGMGVNSTVDLTGHTGDLLLSTLTVGSRTVKDSSNTGTFKFDAGTLDATTIILGTRSTQTTPNVTGNLTLGAGTVTVGTLTMATNNSSVSTTGDAIANLTINGGTNTITTLTMGVNTVPGTATGSETRSTITIAGGATTVSTTFTMGVQNSAANAATNVNTAVSNLTISAGSLTLAGSTNLTMGATTLDADNAAAGTITITGAGTLTVGGNIQYTNGVGTETNIVNLDGGLLDMTGGSIGSAAAPITFNAQSGTLQNLNQLNGGAGLTKTTGGTLVLAGTNAYTGGTGIAAGTVKLASPTALGASAGAVGVTGGAVLDLSGTTMTNTNALTLNGSGIAGGGALANSSALAGTYAGPVSLGSDSSIVAGAGAIVLSNTGAITGPGFALTLGGASTGSRIAGAIATGAGTLTKEGSGTWTLAAANTYGGNTTIAGGTLALGAGGSINDSPAIALAGGAFFDVSLVAGGYHLLGTQTLMGNGTVIGGAAADPGSTLAPGASVGTLRFNAGLALGGTLKVELDGTDDGSADLLSVADLLDITNATVDFDLLAALDDPAYVFASYGMLGGTQFATVLDLPAGYRIDYNYLQQRQIALVEIQVESGIPEPATMALLGLAATSLGRYLRRRRIAPKPPRG